MSIAAASSELQRGVVRTFGYGCLRCWIMLALDGTSFAESLVQHLAEMLLQLAHLQLVQLLGLRFLAEHGTLVLGWTCCPGRHVRTAATVRWHSRDQGCDRRCGGGGWVLAGCGALAGGGQHGCTAVGCQTCVCQWTCVMRCDGWRCVRCSASSFTVRCVPPAWSVALALAGRWRWSVALALALAVTSATITQQPHFGRLSSNDPCRACIRRQPPV